MKNYLESLIRRAAVSKIEGDHRDEPITSGIAPGGDIFIGDESKVSENLFFGTPPMWHHIGEGVVSKFKDAIKPLFSKFKK